ncbi:MAG: DUF488 domain-containing protein [Gammaproteobacteria bacterium]
MPISIKRLGSGRDPDEGLRLGTVRRPPRGVRKEEHATQNYYDVWFPNLAPSRELLKASLPIEDDAAWRKFARAFIAEMKQSGPARDLDLLAALSHHTNFSVGCYCEHERFCHRSLLRELLLARGAVIR